MAVSHARQCKAISKRTGKRCRQPAKKGEDVCRFHSAENLKFGNEGRAASSEKSTGAPRQNINALKHGAYSPRLLPEEKPIYEEKREAFTKALGEVDVFDEQIVHLLSLISVKVDQAVMKGAEHAAYGGMIKQILDLMKELKATRASRDTLTAGQGLTYADLFAALKAQLGTDETSDENGISSEEVGERECPRCGFTAKHRIEADGRLRCGNCGHLAEQPETMNEDGENEQKDADKMEMQPSADHG